MKMHNRNDLINRLNKQAAKLGFGMLGVIPARPAKRLNAYLDWVDKEMFGKMGYLARPDRITRRQDPNVILPNVKSIICLGLDYFTLRLPKEVANDPTRGRISNYSWGADYHDVMTPRLEELTNWLKTELKGDESAHRVYVDTGAILERDHAESAGLGFTGKNTMLIQPKFGSWFFLGEILITEELPESKFLPETAMPSCGSCTRCLDVCPTNAFPAPYVLDARRCISYLTIELKDEIPLEFRPQMKNWIYGCDECQEVCPFNRFESETIEHAFRPDHIDFAAPKLETILRLNETTFKARYANSPIKRIKLERLLRNATIAAGNSGRSELLSHLTPLTNHPSELVQTHAQWGIDQLSRE